MRTNCDIYVFIMQCLSHRWLMLRLYSCSSFLSPHLPYFVLLLPLPWITLRMPHQSQLKGFCVSNHDYLYYSSSWHRPKPPFRVMFSMLMVGATCRFGNCQSLEICRFCCVSVADIQSYVFVQAYYWWECFYLIFIAF